MKKKYFKRLEKELYPLDEVNFSKSFIYLSPYDEIHIKQQSDEEYINDLYNEGRLYVE